MKLALLSSYTGDGSIPTSTKDYLTELTKHFDKVVYLKNEGMLQTQELTRLQSRRIDRMFVPNMGMDFWMFFRYLKKNDIEKYTDILYTNDSCLLLQPLDEVMDRVKSNPKEYLTITPSVLVAPGDESETPKRYLFGESRFIYTKGETKTKVAERIKAKWIITNKADIVREHEILPCQELERDSYIKLEDLLNNGAFYYLDNYPKMACKQWILHTSYRFPELCHELGSPLIKYKFDRHELWFNFKNIINLMADKIYNTTTKCSTKRNSYSTDTSNQIKHTND